MQASKQSLEWWHWHLVEFHTDARNSLMSTNFLKRVWRWICVCVCMWASLAITLTCDIFMDGRSNRTATKKITQIESWLASEGIFRVQIQVFSLRLFCALFLSFFFLYFYSRSNRCDFINKDTVIIAVVLSQILDSAAVRSQHQLKLIFFNTVGLSDHQRNEAKWNAIP